MCFPHGFYLKRLRSSVFARSCMGSRPQMQVTLRRGLKLVEWDDLYPKTVSVRNIRVFFYPIRISLKVPQLDTDGTAVLVYITSIIAFLKRLDNTFNGLDAWHGPKVMKEGVDAKIN
ncbi:298e5ed5-05ae-48f8-8ee5-9d8980f74085-CDS [Sclerotinia trifoliorum]|uniref:298e5ed5-05ae-48f8-8ee5-9d8980f74085-CDS n=1 Tax=Sclerotinia trifoliorum TaxID=28548 RepID=A0A8H2VNQ0_9HELO|nr:298e5ed5-05ae-48f8-8ee5-9d8980f74085-CDS [Sclerotinia trifoliorum]